MKNLIRHQHSIHQNSDTFSCAECNYATPRKSDLNRHIMKRHSNAPTGLNPPYKVARCESSIINPPPNDRLFDQNTQRGFGLSPTDIPDEVHRFFQEEQPWGTDQNLRHVYVQNFHRIRDTETVNRRSRTYLRYINHSSPLIDSIAHAIENIFLCQTNAFKINLFFFHSATQGDWRVPISL